MFEARPERPAKVWLRTQVSVETRTDPVNAKNAIKIMQNATSCLQVPKNP
jgi:hypothetical protein